MTKRVLDSNSNEKRMRNLNYVDEYWKSELPVEFLKLLNSIRNHAVGRPKEIANMTVMLEIWRVTAGLTYRTEQFSESVAEVRVSRQDRRTRTCSIAIVMCLPKYAFPRNHLPSDFISFRRFEMSSFSRFPSNVGDWSIILATLTVPGPHNDLDAWADHVRYNTGIPKNVWLACSEETKCIHDEKHWLAAMLTAKLKMGRTLSRLIFRPQIKGIEWRHLGRPLVGQ